MANPTVGPTAARPLSAILAERGALSLKITLAVFRRVLAQVRALHASGVTHRAIGPESVFLDATGSIGLASTAPVQLLGGPDADPESCPPELCAAVVRLPADMDAARQVLAESKVECDPRRVDIYQLGALLCRMTTGETVASYLRSPKTKSHVPERLRPLIDRALGHHATDRIADCDEFAAALAEASVGSEAAAETPPRGSAVDIPPDTPPGAGRSSAGASSANLPFTKLGHYHIRERIGRGGMGDVYLAFEESLQRQVAVKVLPVELARDEDFVRRFRDEATAVAKLTHPNIVPIYFIGQEGGCHFFAMQYVAGESLDRLLARRKRLPAEEAVGVLEQCLGGLGAAHRAGLVHRDVKPGNILLDAATGRALVADFGLVKRAGGGTGVTATGVVLGTVDYIAPEQARGRPVDGRADLYALGVLTFQMLSGRLPFLADTPSAMIFQHAYEAPPPLRKVAPETPAALADIVDRLMAKDPAARYQSCEEVLADLHRWRAGEPLAEAAPVEPPARVVPISNLEVEPDSPCDSALAALGWWSSLRERALGWLQVRAPELVERLQNTGQQVDGAVAEYQRRRDRLAQLVEEAAEAAEELETQARNHHNAAASVAGNEREECQRIAADLDAQAAEQRQQLSQMREQLAKVDANLNRLRGQRDLLRGRLRVAQARLRMEVGPSRPSRPSRRQWVIAAAVGGLVGLLLVAVLFYALRLSRSTTKTDAGGERAAMATKDAAGEPVVTGPKDRGAASETNVTPGKLENEITNTLGMRLKLIQDGAFTMGALPGDNSQIAQEEPPHLVEITRPFYMGVFPVTKGQFAAFVQDDKYVTDVEKSDDIFKYTWRNTLFTRYNQTDDDPVLNVSWNDAVRYCQWLSRRERKTYQLPTEAEWEYACRAGTTTAYSFGNNPQALDAYAWYERNSMFHTHAVGGKKPNPWGLYDMHGNVCQWCADGYSAYKNGPTQDPRGPDNDAARVYRGGAFSDEAVTCRSAFRGKMASNGHAAILGFRVVLRPVGVSNVNHERRPPPLLVVDPVKPEMPIAMQSPPPVLGSRLFNTGTPSSSEIVTAAAFSPDGKRLFTGGPMLRVWDLERNQALLSFPVTPLLATRTAVWSADGKRVLIGGSIQPGGQIGGVAILYEADTGKVVMTFNGHTSPVGAVALSPDGRQVLTAAGSVQRKIFLTGGVAHSEYQDTEIRRWDVATGKELQRYSGPTAPSHSVAFSPDGKRLFAAGGAEDRAIYSWDLDNPECNRMDFGNRGIRTYIALTDDAGKAGFVGTNSALLTYDLNVRNQLTEGIHTEPLPVYPENPVWSRDGRYLACSSMKYANMQGKAPVYLADMLTGRITTFEGHPLTTKTLAISGDGRFVFSSSTDGNRLWDREHTAP